MYIFVNFTGGVRKDMYSFLPKQIQSRHGYEGCLASLDLNGESPNLMVDAVVPSSQLAAGCEGITNILIIYIVALEF